MIPTLLRLLCLGWLFSHQSAGMTKTSKRALALLASGAMIEHANAAMGAKIARRVL